jgi:hypothetical protein
MTEGGRTVYGGGGITPDEAYETPKLDKLQVELFRSGLFNFTRSYFASHSANLSKGWMPDEVVLTELYAYLKKQGTNFTDGDFTKDRDWIKRYLAKEMYTTAFNVDESDMILRTDPKWKGRGADAQSQRFDRDREKDCGSGCRRSQRRAKPSFGNDRPPGLSLYPSANEHHPTLPSRATGPA